MFTDANVIPPNSELTADVCIVGSGAAGIPLALHLSGRGLSIILIESGFKHEDDKTQALYAGEVADEKLHSPPDKYRQRRFGGSTAIWGGRCMPFDPIDFEKRDYIAESGWPIRYTDLAPYYADANQYLEAGDYAYDADAVFDPDSYPMFKGFTSKIVRTNSLERFSCPTNVGARYEHRLKLAKDINVITGANCVSIGLSKDASSVEKLSLASLEGNRFAVTAKKSVLAVGGIETARLLLTSNDVIAAGIGNEHDLVGRYYQCHIAGNVGTLTINGPVANVRHGYEISPEGIYCRRRLCLAEDAQKTAGVGNMVARLHFPRIVDPSHKVGVLSGLFLAKNFISYEYSKRLNDGENKGLMLYLKHLLNIIRDPIDTSLFLYNWLTKRTFAERKFPSVILANKSNRFSLEIHGEQIPNPSSRITLLDSVDALGVRKVKVDWKYLPEDIESVKKTLDVFADEFLKSGIGQFKYDPKL